MALCQRLHGRLRCTDRFGLPDPTAADLAGLRGERRTATCWKCLRRCGHRSLGSRSMRGVFGVWRACSRFPCEAGEAARRAEGGALACGGKARSKTPPSACGTFPHFAGEGKSLKLQSFTSTRRYFHFMHLVRSVGPGCEDVFDCPAKRGKLPARLKGALWRAERQDQNRPHPPAAASPASQGKGVTTPQ